MKKRVRILLLVMAGLLLLCLAGATFSALSNRSLLQPPTEMERLPNIDKLRVREAQHLWASLGDTVWPAFTEREIPLIVWNQQWSFLIGLDQPPAGWQPVPGDDFLGESYYRQASDDPQNFAVPIGDRWAASLATKSETDAYLIELFREFLPPLIESVFPYRLLIQPSEVQISGLIHESFHVYQQINAPMRLAAAEAVHQSGDAYWKVDEQMHQDWKLEIALLAQALQAKDDQQSADLGRQFLEQRQQRRARIALSAEMIAYERQLEWEEGLAKYVELGIWEAAFNSADYLPVLTGDPDFEEYQTFPQRFKQELSQMKRQAQREGETRFYYTGMAQARLLDRLLPGWKGRILQEGIWLEDLLYHAIQEKSVSNGL